MRQIPPNSICHSAAIGRGFRGQTRGSLRGVRRAGMSARNMRAFARRDRAMNRETENQVARNNTNPGTAGYSGDNQL